MRCKLFLVVATFFLIITSLSAQDKDPVQIKWSVFTQLPAAAGLGGPVAGSHAGMLWIGGGSNFPGDLPWNGGSKVYYDSIYLLQKTTGGNESWLPDSYALPYPVAYAAVVSTAQGIIVLGGENENGPLDSAVVLSWNEKEKKVVSQGLAKLPEPVTSASATVQGNFVYLAGGNTTGGKAVNNFYRLDYSNPLAQWQQLPALPHSVSHAVLLSQSNGKATSLYLIGGRAATDSGISLLYNKAHVFNPSSKAWSEVAAPGESGKKLNALSAATGISTGSTYLLLFGGDDGVVYNQLETLNTNIARETDKDKQQQLTLARNQLLQQHEGFSRNVWLYNTVTDTWKIVGEIPLSQVTTTAVRWNGDIILPSGEIKPGIRTSAIVKGDLQAKVYFSWIDYLVLAVYLLLMVAIGMWTSRRQQTTNDYFRGGQSIPGWANGLSIFGAKLSAITFIGIPAKTYSTDWTYFILMMTIIMVTPMVIRFFIPFYRKLNVTSAYEYLEKRFNYLVRILAALSFILLQLGRMGIVLLLPSLSLSVVTGMPVVAGILIMGVVSIFYTVLGGIEAVIWTEVVQVIILLSGALLSLVLLISNIDMSAGEAWQQLEVYDKLKMIDLNFDLSAPTLWVVLIGGVALNITVYGCDQTVVQRYLTTKDQKSAERSLKLSAWMTLPSTLIFFAIGSLLFLFYKSHPEKVNVALDSHDTIFPWFIVSELPVGVVGLVITAIFAAAMGSLNGSVNAVTTVVVNDIFRKIAPGWDEKRFLRVARITTLAIGTFGVAIALWMANSGIVSLWDQFNTILGLFTGGIAGLFVLGIFSKSATGKGAIAGLLCSLVVQFVVYYYSSLNLLMYALTGMLSCCVLGWVWSKILSRDDKDITGLTLASLRRNR